MATGPHEVVQLADYFPLLAGQQTDPCVPLRDSAAPIDNLRMRKTGIWLCSAVVAAFPSFAAAQSELPMRPGDRVSWDQQAPPDGAAALRFLVHINGDTRELNSVSCEPTPDAGVLTCHANLPAVGPGTYELSVSAYVMRDVPLQSAPSNSLRVAVAAPTTNAPERAAPSPVIPSTALAMTTTEVASGFVDVTDIAVVEGAGVAVAERSGRVHIVSADGAALATFALGDVQPGSAGLMSIAIEARDDGTHLLYGAYVSEDGVRVSRLALGRNYQPSQVAVVLAGLGSTTTASSVLRFGPDGKLYLALDAPDASVAGDAAAHEGKVLRLNADGTTPRDAASHSPIYVIGLAHPSGLAWTRDGSLWIAGATSAREPRLESRETSNVDRGTTLASPVSQVVSIASDRNANSGVLLVGDARAAALWRVGVGRDGSVENVERIAATPDLVRAMAAAANGTVYVATSASLLRLAENPRVGKPVQ